MRIASFNIENGGYNTGTTVEQYVELIMKQNSVDLVDHVDPVDLAKLDIICFQEAFWRTENDVEFDKNNVGEKIAQMLGMNYWWSSEPYGCGIATRYPIIKTYDRNKICGIVIDCGVKMNVICTHLHDFPSYYSALLGIQYYETPINFDKNESANLSYQNKKPDIEKVLEMIDDYETLFVGDFNEPSCLDWTEKAVAAGLVPMKVEWLVSKTLLNAGFVDCCREIYSDEVKMPQYTCNIIRKFSEEYLPDRIDYIYYKGSMKVDNFEIIKHSYSDHLMIVVDLIS